MSPWTRGIDLLKGLLVLVALAAVVLVLAGGLRVLHHMSCNRLDRERLSHLEPGHDTPGPGNIYIKGIAPGPPPSEFTQYMEAASAMDDAGC